MRITHECQRNDLIEELNFLTLENRKLKKKCGIPEDDGVIAVDDDSEYED
jgi:hypothetical protein